MKETKKREAVNTEAKIGFQHSAASGEHLVKGFKVIWHKKTKGAQIQNMVSGGVVL